MSIRTRRGPSLITGRKLAYRSSPAAVAAPGVGSAIRALSGPWLVIVVSIAKMLDEGIVFANFDKFVEKEEAMRGAGSIATRSASTLV